MHITLRRYLIHGHVTFSTSEQIQHCLQVWPAYGGYWRTGYTQNFYFYTASHATDWVMKFIELFYHQLNPEAQDFLNRNKGTTTFLPYRRPYWAKNKIVIRKLP